MADDLEIQKQCIRSIFDLAKEVQKNLAEQANGVLRKSSVSKRYTVLFSSVSKSIEIGDAILHLSQKQFDDEMNVLLRTLVELIVNSCYLQYFGLHEWTDAKPWWKNIWDFLTYSNPCQEGR